MVLTTFVSVTGWTTTFQECDRRKSKTEGKCSYNGGDIFAGWFNVECQLPEWCHSILSGLLLIHGTLFATGRCNTILRTFRSTSTPTSKIPDVYTNGFHTVANPLPAYFSSTITPQLIQSMGSSHFESVVQSYSLNFIASFQ